MTTDSNLFPHGGFFVHVPPVGLLATQHNALRAHQRTRAARQRAAAAARGTEHGDMAVAHAEGPGDAQQREDGGAEEAGRVVDVLLHDGLEDQGEGKGEGHGYGQGQFVDVCFTTTVWTQQTVAKATTAPMIRRWSWWLVMVVIIQNQPQK